MNILGRILYQIDIFICSMIFFGTTDTSLSALAGVELLNAKRVPNTAPLWARILSEICNIVQANHCELSRLADIANAKAAIIKLGGSV